MLKKHNFKVVLSNSLTEDIQETVEYYNFKKKDLGTKFYNSVKIKLKSLKKDALYYQIRYENIRCIRIGKFPYLIHYTLNENSNTVFVFAIICSHKNPDDFWIK